MQCFIYVVGSQHTDKSGKRKLGLTIHPVHRMRQYDIGDCPGEGLKKRYQALFLTTAKSKKELHAIEKLLHLQFKERRLSEDGRITEWFQVSLEEVLNFLREKPYIERLISDDEINQIEEKVRKPRTRDEKDLMEEQEELLEQENLETLKQKFLRIFLKDKSFRSNQEELWERFEALCLGNSSKLYSGIVQWPTATGKTFGELLMIVLANEYAIKYGRVFRCLLVAPKNDIFNTIIHHIRKLSEFGISVCEGHNGQMSSLEVPHDRPVLVTATHAALTDPTIMMRLPSIEMVHYDEVHRIGGDVFFELLLDRMEVWGSRFLTGTSATPKTANPAQHQKIKQLFGDPYNILHKVDIDEAVSNNWIAKPRFSITVASKNQERQHILQQFVQQIQHWVEQKKSFNWKGGKLIAYLPIREEVRQAVILAKKIFPKEWFVYTAVEDADAIQDESFVSDFADGVPRILFACERYREGSDIQGLEMTCILMGNTIASNIILQIIGRALRSDYESKEGWCCVFRPSEEGTSEDDIFDQILLEIFETLGRNDIILERKEITRMVQNFMGNVSISSKKYSLEETVERIQALYERKTFERGVPREKYDAVRSVNRELGLKSRIEYRESQRKRRIYIEKPEEYFGHSWQNWYHFLGFETGSFPQTKAEWVRVCKERDIHTWEKYKILESSDLPPNPSEMYPDYSNWDKEFGVEEEIVW